MTDEKVSLKITLTGEHVTPQVIQNETTALMHYLKSSRLDISLDHTIEEKKESDAAFITKGDPITWGALLLVVTPAILPQILAFIEKMITEGRKIEVQAPNGAKIVFVPNKKMSQEEIMDFIKDLNKIKPSK